VSCWRHEPVGSESCFSSPFTSACPELCGLLVSIVVTPTKELSMNKLSTKLAAGVTLVSLGGLAGFAVNGNHSTASTAAHKQAPMQVRTQVIRRTVRIHRKPKAPKPAPRAAVSPAAAPPRQVATVVPAPPAVAAPVKAHAPLRTRTSGAGGTGGEREREHEHESEGHDD
jgi:hypothetical protein